MPLGLMARRLMPAPLVPVAQRPRGPPWRRRESTRHEEPSQLVPQRRSEFRLVLVHQSCMPAGQRTGCPHMATGAMCPYGPYGPGVHIYGQGVHIWPLATTWPHLQRC